MKTKKILKSKRTTKRTTKKRGGDDFIDKLLKDKAEQLAFYFMINGITDLSNLNEREFETRYLDNINIGYEKIKNNLTNPFAIKELQSSLNIIDLSTIPSNQDEKIELYGKLLYKFNLNHLFIDKNNYGSEAHLLKHLLLDTTSEEYYNGLLKYINAISLFIGYSNSKYTLEQVFKNIGYCIAVYQFVFIGYFTSDDFKENFKNYFYDFYRNFNVENMISGIEAKFIQIQELNNNSIPFLTDYQLLQQYYNIYKYDIDILHKTDLPNQILQTIYYHNTRILRCYFPINLNNNPLDTSIYRRLISVYNPFINERFDIPQQQQLPYEPQRPYKPYDLEGSKAYDYIINRSVNDRRIAEYNGR